MSNIPTAGDIPAFLALRATLMAVYSTTSSVTAEVKAAERAYWLAVEKLILSFPCPVAHCGGAIGVHCGQAGSSKRRNLVMWSVDHDMRVHGSRLRTAETAVRSVDKRAGVLL